VFFQLANEFVLFVSRDENIVRSHTELTRVLAFTPENALGREADIRIGINDDRGLAAKLQS